MTRCIISTRFSLSGLLWCVLVCYGVLWCVVVCCGVLWCVVVCCGVLWCVVVCCGVVCGNVLQSYMECVAATYRVVSKIGRCIIHARPQCVAGPCCSVW